MSDISHGWVVKLFCEIWFSFHHLLNWKAIHIPIGSVAKKLTLGKNSGIEIKISK